MAREFKTQRIVFDDGRRGRQTVEVLPEGGVRLTELVVTRTADGKPCRRVYVAGVVSSEDRQAGIASVYDLNGSSWSLAK